MGVPRQQGTFYECRVRDNDGNRQGTILIEALNDGMVGSEILARFICASDDYYAWWMADGGFPVEGKYHFCEASAHLCSNATSDPVVHVQGFRHLGRDELKGVV